MNSIRAAIVHPSWLMKDRAEFARGLANLRRLGVAAKRPAFPKREPPPEAKAAEIRKAFLDREVSLVIAQRGGYGAIKVLPHLDFGAIKSRPKTLAGFSDLSALLNPVFERTGVPGLHSPMVINLEKPTPFTMASLANALAGFPERNLFEGAPVKVFRGGRGRGILKGGNLATLSSLIGTPWETRTDGCVLFFEDLDQALYKIDRYLSQWILAGKFRRVRGLVLGDFRGIRTEDVFNSVKKQLPPGFPVVHCPFIGHVKDKITLPVGARVELDPGKKKLALA